MFFDPAEFKEHKCLKLLPYVELKHKFWNSGALKIWEEKGATEQGCLWLLKNQPQTRVRFAECESGNCLMSRHSHPIARQLRFQLHNYIQREKPPQDTNKGINSVFTYWSLGPGGLYQDLLLIQKLMLGPLKVQHFNLVFVDSSFTPLFEAYAKDSACFQRDDYELSPSTKLLVGESQGFELMMKLTQVEESQRAVIYEELRKKNLAEKQLKLLGLMDFIHARGGTIHSIRLFQNLSDFFKMSVKYPDIRGDVCVAIDILDDHGVHALESDGKEVCDQFFNKLDMAKHTNSLCVFLFAQTDYSVIVKTRKKTYIHDENYSKSRRRRKITIALAAIAATVGFLLFKKTLCAYMNTVK